MAKEVIDRMNQVSGMISYDQRLTPPRSNLPSEHFSLESAAPILDETIMQDLLEPLFPILQSGLPKPCTSGRVST